MSDSDRRGSLGRRQLFKYFGGAAALVTAGGLSNKWLGRTLGPVSAGVADADGPPANLFFGGTDGWIYLPPTPAIGGFHPDNLAPALPSPAVGNFTTYMFGFRNVTGLSTTQRQAQKNRAQHNAPLFWVDQFDPGDPHDFLVDITNLGLAVRPDLFDEHTLHWHGFRNVIPFFDGEPTGSVAVPPGTVFRYAYRPRDPGTYMYHCHVEDTEHVHMGMTGLVFVRPLQDGNTALFPSGKYMYNDGDGSTGFDREFAMFLSEVWAEAHWADSHIQLPEWSDYHADFSMLNGRVYPDTIAPNGSIDPFHPVRTATGDLIPTPGYEHLQYQPLSSLVNCNAGDRVAMRFANLGFEEAAMTLAGITMRVVGRDATLMRGRDGTDTSYETNTVSIGAGESFDVIFTAPAHSGAGPYDTYMLYDRTYRRSNNLAPGGFGGRTTEIRVHPAGAVAAQSIPNT